MFGHGEAGVVNGELRDLARASHATLYTIWLLLYFFLVENHYVAEILLLTVFMLYTRTNFVYSILVYSNSFNQKIIFTQSAETNVF